MQVSHTITSFLRLLPIASLLLCGCLVLPACDGGDKKPAATKKAGKKKGKKKGKKAGKKLTEEEAVYGMCLCDLELRCIATSTLSEEEQVQAFRKLLPRAKKFVPAVRNAGGIVSLGQKSMPYIMKYERGIGEYAKKNNISEEDISKNPDMLPEDLRRPFRDMQELFSKYKLTLGQQLKDPRIGNGGDEPTPLQKEYITFVYACMGIAVEKQIPVSISDADSYANALRTELEKTNKLLTEEQDAARLAAALQQLNEKLIGYGLGLQNNRALQEPARAALLGHAELKAMWKERQQHQQKLEGTNYMNSPHLLAAIEANTLIWRLCGAYALNE